MAYNSLERLGTYLYRVTFDSLSADNGTDPSVYGGCSSYVEEGKLHRNLDWNYSDLATFHVRCPMFEGIAFSEGLTDTSLDNELIEQLPYRVVDGRNSSGIMVSTHVLFNDWQWVGTGNIPMYKVPYLILSQVETLDNFSAQIENILGNLYATSTLTSEGYLLHFLVTDGSRTFCIMPPESSSGRYVVADISANPKLANFRWVSEKIVTKSDLQLRPTGVERWNMMPCALSELRFTKAYEAPARLSEFIGINDTTKSSADEELLAIYNTAHTVYLNRQRDGTTWQTMHSVVYSSKGIEHLWVQENWSKDYCNEEPTSGYISKAYYTEKFKGVAIPDDEFYRLADIASDVVYDVCILKPDNKDLIDENFKKAVAYQVELLYKQGGVDAIVGFSEVSQTGGSESLGDYSVSDGSSSQEAVLTCNGIPVSAMTLMLLRKLGLMARWAYARRGHHRGKP